MRLLLGLNVLAFFIAAVIYIQTAGSAVKIPRGERFRCINLSLLKAPNKPHYTDTQTQLQTEISINRITMGRLWSVSSALKPSQLLPGLHVCLCVRSGSVMTWERVWLRVWQAMKQTQLCIICSTVCVWAVCQCQQLWTGGTKEQ